MMTRELMDLDYELFKLKEERKKIEEILANSEEELLILREGSDLKYTLNRHLFKLQNDKLELEKRYKPKLEDLKMKIKKLKERISRIKEQRESTLSFT